MSSAFLIEIGDTHYLSLHNTDANLDVPTNVFIFRFYLIDPETTRGFFIIIMYTIENNLIKLNYENSNRR